MSASIKVRPRVVSRSAAPSKPVSVKPTASIQHTNEDDSQPDIDDTVASQPAINDRHDESETQHADEEQPRNRETSVAEPPKDMTRLLYNSMERQRFQTRAKEWPPADGPNDDRCYVVEGTGADNESGETDDDDALKNGLPKGEVVEDHVEPVSQLKERFVDRPQERTPGVNKPIANVKAPVSWIKHAKLPPQYDNDPKELPWMQLVRNRRWKSTVKARFPCKKDDVTTFERRSTTPKNWNNLLRDKHSTKLLSEIAGLEGAGEELLYRLAEQRKKEDVTMSGDDVRNRPMTEEEVLAYQYVRDHLEDAVISAEEEHGRRTGSDGSSRSRIENDYTFTRLLKTPLRLHPEQFKKLLSLERSREATLRWQFSSDPYDSVHEHQQMPFELSLATADNERLIHQALKKLLQTYDYEHDDVFGSSSPPPSTLSRSLSVSSTQRSRRSSQHDDGQHELRSRSKDNKPKQRRSRSVSPSVRCVTDVAEDEDIPVEKIAPLLNSKEEEILREELSKLQKEIGMKELINDLVNEEQNNNNNSLLKVPEQNGGEISSEEEEHNLPLEDRMKKFIAGANRSNEPAKKTNTDQNDIDVSEVASRRRQFLNQEKQSSLEKAEPKREKPRKIVKRCRSDAELHEWLSRRREQTDAAVDEEQQKEQQEGGKDMMAEMTNLINDIQETFSGGGKN